MSQVSTEELREKHPGAFPIHVDASGNPKAYGHCSHCQEEGGICDAWLLKLHLFPCGQCKDEILGEGSD